MAVKYNNTAGRLLAIFRTAKKSDEHKKTVEVWQLALGLRVYQGLGPVAPELRGLVFGHLASVYGGLERIQEDIGRVKSEAAHLYSHGIDALKLAVATTCLESPWKETYTRITEDSLRLLELCANELPQDGEVTQNDVNQINKAVKELFDQVTSSDIDDDLVLVQPDIEFRRV